MSKKRMIVPDRLRQEPLDVRGYDRWQDQEGLVDASDTCREAWSGFRSTWRAARDADLEPRRDEPIVIWELSPHQQHLARRARSLGAAFAMCHATHEVRRLGRFRRRVWYRWRARCQRADLVAWQALWPLLDGVPLVDVAARFGEEPERLGKKVCKLLQWLGEELHISTVFSDALGMKAHPPSSP